VAPTCPRPTAPITRSVIRPERRARGLHVLRESMMLSLMLAVRVRNGREIPRTTSMCNRGGYASDVTSAMTAVHSTLIFAPLICCNVNICVT